MALLWIVFSVVVVLMLALDLGIFNREAHAIGLREALAWSAVWIALGLGFAVFIGLATDGGWRRAQEYLACYLTEKSLSVDNLFVFLVVFRYFGVREEHQHRVLFWGILGALLMRGLFIWLGVRLLEQFEWMTYVLGTFLVLTGARLAFQDQQQHDPSRSRLLRLCRRVVPLSLEPAEGRFFVRDGGRLLGTTLFLALVVIEGTDVVFALDSVPAALAISTDTFVVYTSNVMAILGLRALYFALAGMLGRLRYLHYGLALVLVFVGVKMLLAHTVEITVGISLGVVATILLASLLASLVRGRGE